MITDTALRIESMNALLNALEEVQAESRLIIRNDREPFGRTEVSGK